MIYCTSRKPSFSLLCHVVLSKVLIVNLELLHTIEQVRLELGLDFQQVLLASRHLEIIK